LIKKILLLIFSSFLAWSAAADTGKEIMQKVIDTQQASSAAMDISMLLADNDGGQSTRRIQTLSVNDNGLTKTIMVFLEPASVKNTRFLTIENESRGDDQWIYLPALRKVKRIASSEQSGSFMGSDFSYSDMSFANSVLDDSTYAILREEIVNGLDCYVVESIPARDTDSQYGKEITWVDKATWLTPRVEFYAKDGRTLLKVLEAEDFKQIQGREFAGKMTMTTVATEHATTLEFREVKYDIPIDQGYFTTTFLKSGRKR